jgi:hypothetical protein
MYTENELVELEQYFKSVILTKEIQLTKCEMVADVKLFIKTSLAVCRENMGVKAFEAAYDRLVKLKELLIMVK